MKRKKPMKRGGPLKRNTPLKRTGSLKPRSKKTQQKYVERRKIVARLLEERQSMTRLRFTSEMRVSISMN